MQLNNTQMSKYMNKTSEILAILYFTFLTISCEKIDKDIAGVWQLSESYYKITAKEDFSFYDPFNAPWSGTISIDDKVMNASDFIYSYDNTRGNTILSSKDAVIVFNPHELIFESIDYQSYVLKSYDFNMQLGVLKAKGTATGNNKSIAVDINASIPKTDISAGDSKKLKDAFHTISYLYLNLRKNGTLNIDYLAGDIVDRVSGKYNTNNDHITLSPKGHDTRRYKYGLTGNTLRLFNESVNVKQLPQQLEAFANNIDNITFVAEYSRIQ